MHHFGYYGYGIDPVWFWTLRIGGFVLLIVAAFFLIKAFKSKNDSAIDLVKAAYAEGEISEEEYLRKIELLRK